MHLPPALKHALQNKYIAATVLALVWSVFIHDLGLPFVVREARNLERAKKELSAVEARNESLRQQQATKKPWSAMRGSTTSCAEVMKRCIASSTDLQPNSPQSDSRDLPSASGLARTIHSNPTIAPPRWASCATRVPDC